MSKAFGQCSRKPPLQKQDVLSGGGSYSQDQPVAIIKTTSVDILPMNEVPESFAIAEGEGDRTYQYWWNTHEEFFKNECKAVGQTFSEDILLVCERFELIHACEASK